MRVRTGYSFHHAVGHLPEVITRLQQIDYAGHAPISDRLSAFAFASWTKLTQAANLQPVYGIELPVSDGIGTDWWTFFAINDIATIYSLVAQATRRQPAHLTYAEAQQATGVIKLAGERVQLSQCDPLTPYLWLPLSPSLPKGLYNQAVDAGYRFMACSDNVYTQAADKEFYRCTLGRHASVQTWPQHLLAPDEWASTLRSRLGVPAGALDAAQAAQGAALALCHATLPKASLLQPHRPATLRALCEAGAAAKGCDLTRPQYRARLARELAMIAEKAFEDYFYIVGELVNWARQHMVVGPARGSSCGSLVCYLLNITAVDPIPHGLLFERFIDVTRNDLPDIDIDFQDDKRHLVFAHAAELYGAERMARLGNVNHFKARSALKAAATALRIPNFMIDKVLDVMIERTSGDARANEALAETLRSTKAGQQLKEEFPSLAIAERMEAHPSGAGQHAAGILLTNEPIAHYVAIDQRNGVAMCDKRDVDTFGLLKIDALGLTQLSVFGRTLELINQPQTAVFLEQIPLDDKAAFDVLNNQHFAGIFQFQGIAVQSLAKQVHIDNFNDVVAIGALGRPGPIGGGGATTWIMRRSGTEPVTYPHPVFEQHLSDTYGVIVFQEQIMQIGRMVGDLSWADVTALRKAMSKSMGQDYFDTFGDKWKAAAVAKGVPQMIADSFWRSMCTFGNWSFNRSHAVAYGLISYWCCWLKAHHPLAFAAATLDYERDPIRQLALLRELAAEGIDYVPVDAEHSGTRWQPHGTNKLLGPLTAIKGIGPAALNKIIAARTPGGPPLKPGVMAKLQNAQTAIGSLYPIADAIAKIDLPAQKIFTPHTLIKQAQINGDNYELVIIGVLKKLAPKDLNEALNVAKRGGRRYPDDVPHMACNLFIVDDTDQILCHIDRFNYTRLATPMLEHGAVGKALYAIKGRMTPHFRMINISNVRLLGSIDDDHGTPGGGYNNQFDDNNTGINQPQQVAAE